MEGLSDSRGVVHWFVGALMTVATTILLVWSGADSTAAGMVFLVLVVWASTQAGISLSLYRSGSLRALVRLLFPAAVSYVSIGGRTGVGGHDFVPGLLVLW